MSKWDDYDKSDRKRGLLWWELEWVIMADWIKKGVVPGSPAPPPAKSQGKTCVVCGCFSVDTAVCSVCGGSP